MPFNDKVMNMISAHPKLVTFVIGTAIGILYSAHSIFTHGGAKLSGVRH